MPYSLGNTARGAIFSRKYVSGAIFSKIRLGGHILKEIQLGVPYSLRNAARGAIFSRKYGLRMPNFLGNTAWGYQIPWEIDAKFPRKYGSRDTIFCRK